MSDHQMNNHLGNGREIIAIVSVDKSWGIGKTGTLLVHLSCDMKYFKEITIGNIVVMGRKTFESLPGAKPLPDRLNVVITRNEEYAKELVSREDILTAKSVEESIEMFATDPEDTRDLFVIGGGEIYRQFLPFVDSCLVTKIDAEFEADTFFPNLDAEKSFELTNESDSVTEDGISFVFTEYSRVK